MKQLDAKQKAFLAVKRNQDKGGSAASSGKTKFTFNLNGSKSNPFERANVFTSKKFNAFARKPKFNL